ncbi:YigZ family protein [Putridiphycobacter roseus]|uniref:YigZ family protein n=1 Tax=Putridiphycobacter roseus TaxID=2219161 RepID=A0A2W1MYG8_9FLAO|nr:YigZ family protein [Putridiphycobacter roseus]PZE16260.1 YigZ family protein [Putridiphycobacter roseus]
MKKNDSCNTVIGVTEGFYKEKGSKFLAYALNCEDETHAKKQIDQYRKENPNACHVCFAWRFGFNEPFTDRFSDDGEPNNSAGKPIFGQIISFDVSNILIAVVRYYGGTNLGVGGLMNAYKTAAKDALEKAKIKTIYDTSPMEVVFDYDQMGNIMNLLSKYQVNQFEQGFIGTQGKLNFSIRKSFAQKIINEVTLLHNVTLKNKD